VAASASATFYVVVPAFANKAIKVEVLTPNGAYHKSSSSATLAGNDMGLLAIATSSSTLDANRGVTQGHEWVKIGGIKWATCNIGANSPEEVGYFFSWGNTTGYNLTRITGETPTGLTSGFNSADYTGSASTLATNLPANTTYDAARRHWGSSWRIPTSAEMTDLSSRCSKSMVTTNPYGIQLTSTSDPNLKLFFPSGRAYRNGGINPASLTGGGGNTDYNGDYWSSTYSSSENAWCLGFCIHTVSCSQGTGNHIHFDVLSGGKRFNGRNIRPVCGL